MSPELQARIDELPNLKIRVIARYFGNRGIDAVDALLEAYEQGLELGRQKAVAERTEAGK
jgi:hypothetical protein